ncbi:MAG: hypothetical protein COA43_11615 [Robiginitomaculum sp.]|nr:MAG: hypothetical protein COA43_11615 [Robiginitomaculum sp.]
MSKFTKPASTLFVAIILPSFLSACVTTPKVEEVVEIIPPEAVQTCYPVDSLEKVVIPAVIKRGFSIVSIENPDEYYTDPKTGETITIKNPPIETKTPYSKIVTPEKVYYKVPGGDTVTDICEHYVDGEAPASAPELMPTPEPEPRAYPIAPPERVQ